MVHLFRRRDRSKALGEEDQAATQLLPETVWTKHDADPMPTGIPPEDNVVVTISRQLGSGGAEIGRMVAQKSGLHYVDHQIIDEVARRLGVQVQQVARKDEYTVGVAEHILQALQQSSPFTSNYQMLFNPLQHEIGQFNELAYLHLTQKVILELATQGNALIVGRGSQFLLHGLPRTLHIHIFAPRPHRIENVMKRFQVDRTRAAELIEQRDYEYDSYLRRYYGANGHQPDLYHLLLNTGLFSFESAADLICQALEVAKEIKG
jgi:cytidylate kinase